MKRACAVLSVLLAIPLTFSIAIFFREILGRLDALLLSCKRRGSSISTQPIGPAALPHHHQSARDCLQDGYESTADRILWFLFSRIFNDAIDDDALSAYVNFRRYVSFGALLARADWLLCCCIKLSELSVSSVAGSFSFNRALQYDGSMAGDRMSTWDVSSLGLSTMSTFTMRNVARVNIVRNASLDAGYTPPPSLEIENLALSWRSWREPVVDLEAINVRINVVLRILNDDSSILPHPVAFLGNTSLDDAIELLPRPPPHPGTYPRIGKINVTDLVVCFHKLPPSKKGSEFRGGQCSEELERAVQVAEVVFPKDLLGSLLNATASAGSEGIDPYYFQSFLEETFRQSLLLMSEKKVRKSLEKVGNAIESISSGIEKKLHESGAFGEFVLSSQRTISLLIDGLYDDFAEKMKGMSHAAELLKDVRDQISSKAMAKALIDTWKNNSNALMKKILNAGTGRNKTLGQSENNEEL